MVRGSTPTHTFTLPFEPPSGSEFRIVYAQGEDYKEKTLFELITQRCGVDGRKITVRLKQAESLLFDCTPVWIKGRFAPPPVKIQVGVQTPGNDILWGEIINTTVDRCLRKDGCVCDG